MGGGNRAVIAGSLTHHAPIASLYRLNPAHPAIITPAGKRSDIDSDDLTLPLPLVND